MIVLSLLHAAGALKTKALRRRWVERTLHRIGMSRRRAMRIARLIP